MNDYDIETDEYLKNGLTLFQCRLYGNNEQEHIRNYCSWLKPNGVVVDMGSGVGAMGAGMVVECRGIDAVINVTNSQIQADYIAQHGGRVICRDFHSVPEIPNETVDFVMFNETIGYGDMARLFKESCRMLRPKGRVVIKDFAPLLPNEHTDLIGWEYKVAPLHEVIQAAADTNLRCTLFSLPLVSSHIWEKFMQESKMSSWHGCVEYCLDSTLIVFEKVGQ